MNQGQTRSGTTTLNAPRKLLAVLMSIVLAVGLCPIARAEVAWAVEGESQESSDSGVNESQTEDDAQAYVAQITESGQTTKYKSLQEAFDAAKENEETTIELLNDVEDGGVGLFNEAKEGQHPAPVNKTIIVDFKNHTYTVGKNLVGSTGYKSQAFHFEKGNTVKLKNGSLTSTKAAMLIQNYCNLTLDHMKLDGSALSGDAPCYTLSNNCGNVTITDTEIVAKANGYAFDVCRYSSYPSVKVSVEGNSEIKGNVEISASGSDAKEGFGLALNGGSMTGKLIMDNGALNAWKIDPDKVAITKSPAFVLDAPEGYAWDTTDSVSKLTYAKAKTESGYCETLKEAIANNGSGDAKITLLQDIVLSEPEEIAKNATIDLNGHKISSSSNAIFSISSGNVVVKDSSQGASGLIATSKNNVAAISVDGAQSSFTLESGKVESSGNGGYGIAAFNGATATIAGGEVNSESAALSCNNLYPVATLNVSGGKLSTAKGPAIYKPSYGTLTVTGGVIDGGISIRVGTVNISGGTITGPKPGDNNANIDAISEYYKYSGNAWLGDTVYVWGGTYTNNGSNAAVTSSDVKLNISGGEIKNSNAGYSAVTFYDLGKVEQQASVNISGGTLTSSGDGATAAYRVLPFSGMNITDAAYGVYSGKMTSRVSGGTFSHKVDDEFLVDEYESVQSENAWTVQSKQYEIAILPTSNGSVSVSPDSGWKYGDQVTVDITPSSGYALDNLSVTDENGVELTVVENKFSMPKSNVQVAATFKSTYVPLIPSGPSTPTTPTVTPTERTERAIDSLPAADEVAVGDEGSIEGARAAYEALSDAEKAAFPAEELAKLEAAERALASAKQARADEEARAAAEEAARAEAEAKAREEAEAKAAADRASAEAAAAAMAGADPSSAASVEAARAAYEGLTPEQRALVDPAAVAQLGSAEQAISDPQAGAEIGDVAVASGTVDVEVTGKATVTLESADVAPGSSVTVDSVAIAGRTYAVTAIAPGAFEGTGARSVTVGPSVRSIGASAFANAKSLVRVSVGGGVAKVAKSAFAGDSRLKSVTLGRSVRTVGKNAFKGCKALSKVTVKSSRLTRASIRNIAKNSKVRVIKLSGVSKKAKKSYKKWAPKGVRVR